MILITQILFHQTNHCRTISLNEKYIVLMKNTTDKKRFTYLARQVYPEDSAGLYEAYLEATKQPHGYLVLDFAQYKDGLLLFRTRIIPGDGPPAFYTP